MKKIGSFLFILLVSISAKAEVRVEATVDKNRVSQDDSLTLSITVSGDSDLGNNSPTLAELKDFEVMNSYTQSSSQSVYSNGKFQFLRQTKYMYTLMPQKTGNLVIGPAEVEVKGQTLKTKPITITVTAGGSNPKTNPKAFGKQQQRQQMQEDDEEDFGFPKGFDDEADLFSQLLRRRGFVVDPRGGVKSAPQNPDSSAFFITVEANKKRVYVGEQIVATWYIYTRGGVQSYESLKYPELKGFWKEDLEIANQLNFQPEVINGVQYNRALLVSYALFPISPGKKMIDQLKSKATIIDTSGGMGAFGIGRPFSYTKASQELPIDVLPLPTEGKPQSFTGAVGKFNITGSLSATSVKVNQPVSLKIRFQGRGNVKSIELPALNFPSGLEVYDTKKESQYNKNGEGFIEFEVLVIPRKAGDISIAPINLSFFDPQTVKFVVRSTPEFKLKVLPGDGSPNSTASSPLSSSTEPTNDQSVVKELRMLKTESKFVLDPSIRKVLWFLGLLLPLSWLVLSWRRIAKAGTISELDLKKRAQGKLKMARKKLSEGDHRTAGVEIVNAILSVLGEVSGRGGASQTADELLIQIPQASEALKERTMNLLSQCELMSFAPDEVAQKQNKDKKILSEAEKIIESYFNLK